MRNSVLLMGPAGSGKTTLGREVAARLCAEFVDGDELHTAANIEKMRRGERLTDADRGPWLDRIAAILRAHVAGRGIVVACSALKRTYRDRLHDADATLKLVLLNAPQTVLQDRVRARQGHYMPAELVQDQCEQLEIPGLDEPALLLDATAPLEVLLLEVQNWLDSGVRGGAPSV
jgi:gluconokinase